MMKRIDIAAKMRKMQTAVRHLGALCSRKMQYGLLLAVANSSLFTLHSSLLVGCTNDDESEATSSLHESSIELSASMSVVPLKEAETHGVTRSWSAPAGYSLYAALYSSDLPEGKSFLNFQDLSQSTINLFLFYTGTLKNPKTPNPLNARLRYRPTPAPPETPTKYWKLMLPNTVNEDDVNGGDYDYYVYGFVPGDAADNATIGLLEPEDPDYKYADGAVLTINGLKTVGYDACVIIGAKEGFSADYDGSYTDNNSNSSYDPDTDTRTDRLRAGNFKFKLDTGYTGEGKDKVYNSNYLYFLFDHLCSALIINMRVNGEYNALRHIKLKNIHVQTATDDGPTKKTANVVVTLEANDTGATPIQSITYTPTGDATSGNNIFTSAEGHLLTTDFEDASFLTHFIPKDVTTLIVTCTYDVYDTNITDEHRDGNLIRKDCTATNTIPMKLIDRFETAERGKKYTLNMTINPTYLYMMSDPDLNNPTMEVE